MKSVKKSFLIATCACATVVGVTLAYISDMTETAVNTFSSDKSISLKLREPAWDGYEFNDEYPSDVVPGSSEKPGSTIEDLGVVKAKNYYPGYSLNKNPMVQNTSKEESEYVAIKIEYVIVNDNGGETTLSKSEFEQAYGKLKSNADNDNNGINDRFVKISKDDAKYDLYMYGSNAEGINIPTKLKKDATTVSLFDQVVVNQNILTTSNGKWPNFRIKVTGYAIQTVSVNAEQATSELNNLAKGN